MISSLTMYGALADVNAALSSVQYTPRLNWNSVMGELDLLSISASRSEASSSPTAPSVPAKIPIFVAQVNDAPQVTIEPAGKLAIDEDTGGVVNISITDVDAAEASSGLSHPRGIINVTLKVSHGSLQIKESLMPLLFSNQVGVST